MRCRQGEPPVRLRLHLRAQVLEGHGREQDKEPHLGHTREETGRGHAGVDGGDDRRPAAIQDVTPLPAWVAQIALVCLATVGLFVLVGVLDAVPAREDVDEDAIPRIFARIRFLGVSTAHLATKEVPVSPAMSSALSASHSVAFMGQ